MTITRADEKQEEFFTTNGKLYINFEQVEKKDDDDNVFWEMKTLEVADRRTAYLAVEEYKKSIKNEVLNKIIVTLEDGTRFYADPTSRTDLNDCIQIATEQGADDTAQIMWKTPDGIKLVTIGQLREARKLGLEEKANIIGVQ